MHRVHTDRVVSVTLAAENFAIMKTEEGTSTDEGRERGITTGDIAVTNLDGGNPGIMRLSLRKEWADFRPSTVASYHYIEPSRLWLVFEDQRIGSIIGLFGLFDFVSPFDSVLRDGLEEEGAELSAVDFGTGALTWSGVWAFVVEDGGRVVCDAHGFALRTKDLGEFGCEICGFYGGKAGFFMQVKRTT